MSKKTDADEARKVIMWEIDVDVDADTYSKLRELGLQMIRNDDKALVSYAARRCLEDYIAGVKEKG